MKKQKDERINLILKLMMALLFILGVLVFSYPFVVDSINNYYDQKAIEKLHKENQEKFKTKKHRIYQEWELLKILLKQP
jgi:sortase A